MHSILRSILTGFVLRVTHERLVHRFRCHHFVLLLGNRGRGRGHDGLGDDLERLDDADIAQPLGNRECSLALVRDGVRRRVVLEQEVDDQRVSLLCRLVKWRVPGRRRQIHVGAVCEQEADHVHVAEVRRNVDSRVAGSGLLVDVALVVDQNLRHVHAVLLRAQMKSREPVLQEHSRLKLATHDSSGTIATPSVSAAKMRRRFGSRSTRRPTVLAFAGTLSALIITLPRSKQTFYSSRGQLLAKRCSLLVKRATCAETASSWSMASRNEDSRERTFALALTGALW